MPHTELVQILHALANLASDAHLLETREVATAFVEVTFFAPAPAACGTTDSAVPPLRWRVASAIITTTVALVMLPLPSPLRVASARLPISTTITTNCCSMYRLELVI